MGLVFSVRAKGFRITLNSSSDFITVRLKIKDRFTKR